MESVTSDATRDSMVELMSAVMDGEASAAETERLFEALAGDADLRARWQRFHHASQLLSASERAAPDSRTLERRFVAALENELPHGGALGTAPATDQPRGASNFGPWWRIGGGLAVAAAVAFAVVAFLGEPSARESLRPEPVIAGVEVAMPEAAPAAVAAVRPAQAEAVVADIERQTQALMLLHMQRAAVSSHARVMPVAKLAAFTAQSE